MLVSLCRQAAALALPRVRGCATAAAAPPADPSVMRWAVGGWSFFIVENLVLSHNRQSIIDAIGEKNYFRTYGTFSTFACASIGYGYLRRVAGAAPFAWAPGLLVPAWRLAAAFMLQGIGLAGLLQDLPRLQSPVVPAAGGAAQEWIVQCPMDFAAQQRAAEVAKATRDNPPPADAAAIGDGPRGLARVSRHDFFWSFGLTCLGAAVRVPSIPQAAWLAMPTLVALVGGAHRDYRFRRGQGGSLTAAYEAQTSHVPFVALLSGAQGPVSEAAAKLWAEIKGSNAVAGGLAAALWTLRRVR